MKKIKIFTLLLFLIFTAWNAKSQQNKNNHHGVQDLNLNGDIATAAYEFSEIDMRGSLTGEVTFISSFTYEDVPNNRTYLHFRRTSPCLDYHTNYYNAATIPYVSSSYKAFSVNDLKEVKGTGRYEVVICGTFLEKEGYIAMFDSRFNPITNINTYSSAHTYHSIMEIPGYGFLACGEGYGTRMGVIIALDYRLNLISTYISGDYKFTDIAYDEVDNYAYIAGYSDRYELCAYGLDVRRMFLSQPNPVFGGFTYINPGLILDWNASGKDDVKIIHRYDKYVTIAASGSDIYARTPRNVGILHENLIDGSHPGANIQLVPTTNSRSNNIYLKGLAQFRNNRYNLLLLEEEAMAPSILTSSLSILDMDLNNNNLDVLNINLPAKTPVEMLNRSSCKMLDILYAVNTVNNSSMLLHSSCYISGFSGLQRHSMESYINVRMPRLTPQIGAVRFLSQIDGAYNPNYFPTNIPLRSNIASTISLRGDCSTSCLRSAYIEDETLDIEDVVKENNPIMIYNNSIEIFDIAEYSHYRISDIMGRQVKNAEINSNIISIDDIPHGTYFISFIKANGEVEHHKFMRQ